LKKSLAEHLSARQAATREISHALSLAADNADAFKENEIRSLALRIKQCGKPDNTYIAHDAYNVTTGECYDAVGNLWQCNSKLCPSCVATQARRNRKKLRDAMQQQRLGTGERFYFVTFTIPNPKLSIIATRAIVDRAWTLFRKRKLCVSLIRGGAKSEEFTLTANGYHYHLHFIWKSRYLSYQEVRRTWTECVEIAFDEAEQPFAVNTKDGYCIAKILPMINREKTIQEVCKYITKSDSWYKMRESDLTDLALIKRWFRMFELFGDFAMKNDLKPQPETDDAEPNAIVHTRNLTDAFASHQNRYWRDVVAEIGYKNYETLLAFEIEQTQKARLADLAMRWKGSTIVRSSDLG